MNKKNKPTMVIEFGIIQILVFVLQYFNVINWQWYMLILPLTIWTLTMIVLVVRDLYIWKQNKIINNKK